MPKDLIEYKTHISPRKLLKSMCIYDILYSDYSRGVLLGKISILYCQGFISHYTYNRYIALLEKAQDGLLKLRKRGINKCKCQK